MQFCVIKCVSNESCDCVSVARSAATADVAGVPAIYISGGSRAGGNTHADANNHSLVKALLLLTRKHSILGFRTQTAYLINMTERV